MKFDRIFNRISEALFGYSPDLRPKLYLHSQNLNEDRGGNPKGLPWHGRLWMNWNDKFLLRFEWVLWSRSCGISVKSDAEDGGLLLHAAFPPVSFYLSLPILKKWSGYRHKTLFDLAIHNWTAWWQFGGNEMEWSSQTPKWKHGSFHFDDFFLGRTKFESKIIETRNVQIPMPEGVYQGKAKMEESTWKRARWFTRRESSIWIDVERGIPHEGKGESDYNCGPDAVHGCGVTGTSYPAAVAHYVEVVLKNRKKYNGSMDAKYPPPLDNTDLNALLKKAGEGPNSEDSAR